MKNKISNSAELREQIKLLQEKAILQENILRQDIAEIREQLRPKNIFWNTIASITGIKLNANDMLSGGFIAGLLLILKKFISKTESKAEDKVYGFTDKVFERIRKFLSSVFNVRRHYAENDDSGVA